MFKNSHFCSALDTTRRGQSSIFCDGLHQLIGTKITISEKKKKLTIASEEIIIFMIIIIIAIVAIIIIVIVNVIIIIIF